MGLDGWISGCGWLGGCKSVVWIGLRWLVVNASDDFGGFRWVGGFGWLQNVFGGGSCGGDG